LVIRTSLGHIYTFPDAHKYIYRYICVYTNTNTYIHTYIHLAVIALVTRRGRGVSVGGDALETSTPIDDGDDNDDVYLEYYSGKMVSYKLLLSTCHT
jgi:hypothetical protein